ncbi:hypothetical protein PN481_00955, partial [Nodularia spumigena CS-588/06]|uniref:hypothetical protein n=1 Tax=Nodularia spumigena TaxID=70799 RepID=UPI00232F42FA
PARSDARKGCRTPRKRKLCVSPINIDLITGLTQQLPKILIYRTAKPPRTPRKCRVCVSPSNKNNFHLDS